MKHVIFHSFANHNNYLFEFNITKLYLQCPWLYRNALQILNAQVQKYVQTNTAKIHVKYQSHVTLQPNAQQLITDQFVTALVDGQEIPKFSVINVRCILKL